MDFRLLEDDVQAFIRKNEKSDIRALALKQNPFPEIDYREILTQIVGLSKARKKLPTFYNTPKIYYPSRVSMEQCSSEITANFKASLFSGNVLIDLTAGVGVDVIAFSKHFEKVIYCETSQELCEIAAHNFAAMKIDNIEIFNGDGLEFLKNSPDKFDVIYIDPSRRDENAEKVYGLEDCTPNVIEHKSEFLQKADKVLIKVSPLVDISLAKRQINKIVEVNIAAVENDVKELLFLLEMDNRKSLQINTINFKNEKVEEFSFDDSQTDFSKFSLPKKYIYEPNAAIMKSGGFNNVGNFYDLGKLHQNSHLYTSENLEQFPGRVFEVIETLDYGDKRISKLLAGKKCNITVRNFPLTVAQIRQKWKIKDGGDLYCFFTTNIDDQKIALFCKKLD